MTNLETGLDKLGGCIDFCSHMITLAALAAVTLVLSPLWVPWFGFAWLVGKYYEKNS